MLYKPKTHVTTQADRIRPNYAAIMGDLIKSMAEEQGVSEEEYRAMIQTPGGKEVFRFVCEWYGVPLFTCNHRERRKAPEVSEGNRRLSTSLPGRLNQGNVGRISNRTNQPAGKEAR